MEGHEGFAGGSSGRDADLVLGPGEFAFVQDGTKGTVAVMVGPHKTSLSQTDRPVTWDRGTRRFKRSSQQDAINPWLTANEVSYIVLDDPATDQSNEHPSEGGARANIPLQVGRRINIPGPSSFPLWPGQSARVVPGHRLRSDQYLIVRVLNDEEARANWSAAVVHRQTADSSASGSGEGDNGGEEGASEDGTPAEAPVQLTEETPPDLVMGQLIMIPGTQVSFYIPPTGLEVVKEASGDYVRNAVTLELLEYCILLDESGDKRYVRGPAVVFPTPTESFVERKGRVKFRAVELNEITGIYVKVLTDYTDEETDERHKAGDELFITGGVQAIYYPRPEHAIIRYGDRDIHYAVVVPEGEGRYLLNRMTGEVPVEMGPVMLLPDPRTNMIVRRVLTRDQVSLWFPGNQEAQDFNDALRRADTPGSGWVTERTLRGGEERSYADHPEEGEGLVGSAAMYGTTSRSLGAERVERKDKFTPPATVTIDAKFDGAVRIAVWPGFAVMVVDNTGDRRVVQGPETTILGFGEILHVMSFSRGERKSDENLLRTPYLQVRHNTVSDVVKAETRDMFDVSVRLSYRVNFEGEDPERWFGIDNYVQHLVEHLRSLLRSAIGRHGVEHFYENSTAIVRDAVLGVSEVAKLIAEVEADADSDAVVDLDALSPDSTGAASGRPGRSFPENGMHVYEVEVLDVVINDDVHHLLITDRRDTVRQELRVASVERGLEFTRREQEVARREAEEQDETARVRHELSVANAERDHDREVLVTNARADVQALQRTREQALQDVLDEIAAAELARARAIEAQDVEFEITREELAIRAHIERLAAIKPDLIAVLQAFSDADLAGKLAESMGPLAILGGSSVVDVATKMLEGTKFAGVINGLGRTLGSGDAEDGY